MSIDRANIFKLSNQELKQYIENPFIDCFESTKSFAEALKYDIDTKETPHILLLSAEYGMGKTFFSTRFTQFLKNNNYDVIYFSVWENDYLQEPFIAFSKEIIKYINNKFKTKKYENSIKNLFGTIEDIMEAFSINLIGTGVSFSAQKLINTFKQEDDHIIKLRKNLSNFISKIKSKKLIIILDELDRCRPDYAMKTLECIKHFFDIEGLFIIIPTNITALNNGVKSLYGIDNSQNIENNKECYFKKFFNDIRELKKTTLEDYKCVVKQYLTPDTLKQAINKKFLSLDGKKYNSFNNLINFFSEYSYKAGLTLREVKDYSQELIRICNNFYEPIRTEWLACILDYKKKKDKSFPFSYPLPREHCFNSSNNNDGKAKLFKLEIYFSSFNNLRKNITPYYDSNGRIVNTNEYSNTINSLMHEKQNINLNNYKKLYEYLKEKNTQIKNLEKKYNNCEILYNNLKIIEDSILKQKKEIKNYQYKYGSEDNDEQRKNNYLGIINKPENLYILAKN